MPANSAPKGPLARAGAGKTAPTLRHGVDAAQPTVMTDPAVSPAGGMAIATALAPAAASKADAVLKQCDDAAQAAGGSDAALQPPGTTAIALAPAGVGAPAQDLPAAASSPQDLPAGVFAPPQVLPPAAFSLPQKPTAAPPLSPAFAPAGSEVARTAPDARKHPLADAAAAPKGETDPPIAPVTAEIAAPGKFAPPVEGEFRRAIADAANLQEAPKTAPAAVAGIHMAGAAPVQPTHAPNAALEPRVGEQGWDRGLGDKLVWMASQKQQVAELHLNPPELGPLKITLTLNDAQASAQFVSAHATVREAIEGAMPRLREMLADNGITLGNASVSADAFREQPQPQQQARAQPAPGPAAAADPGAPAHGELLLRRPRGLVDTFA